jgi:hypothetical protein
MGDHLRRVERDIALIATAAHGVVTRAQLMEAGLTRGRINRRVANGMLIPVHRGVYRVGHRAPSVEATYLAAVRACGEGAVLSGRAAAYLLGIIRGSPPPPEVTAPGARRVPGVRTHRTGAAHPKDAGVWRGVPVASPARTMADLAAVLPVPALARALHEAGIRHGTTPEEVEEVLARRPSTRGARELRRVLRGDAQVTLSRLESRFLELLAEAGLELPVANRPEGGRYVDCRWPAIGLTVELDGYTYHRSRHAWEQDRRREREARARGDDFRRLTRDDVFERWPATLRELRAALPTAPRAPAGSRSARSPRGRASRASRRRSPGATPPSSRTA